MGWAATVDDLALAARYYDLHLLSLAGLQPQLRRCVICGTSLEAEDQFFSPVEGGVVCPRCAEQRAGGPNAAGWMPVSLSALKLLRYIQSNPYARVAVLKVS